MRKHWLIPVLLVVAAVMAIHATYYAFLCDDAYIMFRYARNLAIGRGLVFNVGDWVEGYTSLLWTLQLALGERLGISSEIFAYVLSAVYTALTLVVWSAFIYRQGPRHTRGVVLAIVLGLLALNRSWAVWTTSGLETRSFTFYTLLSFYALLRAETSGGVAQRRRWLAATSVILALAVFSRPDAQVVFLGFAAYGLWRYGIRAHRDLARLVLPFAVLVGLHYAWRLYTYGYWLPNTYYAKVEGPWPEMGWRYAAAFVLEYGLYLVVPIVAFGWRRIEDPLTRRMLGLLGVCMALHAGYYCGVVGGDHFEYRIFDFYLPVIAWATAESLVAIGATHRAVAIAAGLVFAVYGTVLPFASAVHSPKTIYELYRPDRQYKVTVANTPIAGWLPGMPWVLRAHRELMSELNAHLVCIRWEIHKIYWKWRVGSFKLAKGIPVRGIFPDAVVADGNVGVLGYYIDLPLVDALGLTDAFVAHHGVKPRVPMAMAHDSHAPRQYFERRHAHLLIISATHDPAPQNRKPSTGLPTPRGRIYQTYSVRIADDVFLNIATWDPKWLRKYFRLTSTQIIPKGRALSTE